MFTRKKQGSRSFFPFGNLSLGKHKYRSDQNPERTQPKLFPQYGAFAKRSSLTAPKKCTFYFNVNVFSTKVLIWDTIFLPLLLETRDRHFTWSSESHEGLPVTGQREYLHFSVTLRPWVLVWPQESNPQAPALQSSALPTELIPPRLIIKYRLVSSQLLFQ